MPLKSASPTSTRPSRRLGGARRLGAAALLPALVAAIAAACTSPPTGEHWTTSRAYVHAFLHDTSGIPVAGATVRILVADGACPNTNAATMAETQSNAAGAAALLVESLPVDSFSACVRLQVAAPAGFRDTTTTGYNATFRSPAAAVVDTVSVDIALGRL